MKKVRICIIVEGGVVQSVLSDRKDVEVELIDHDCEDESEKDRLDGLELDNEYPYEVF